jgi:RimJ/RimL family protein N-acetyltransferase
MSQTPEGEPQDAAQLFQISRYPATLIDVWTLRNGARITLRPVLPQDHGLLGDMVQRLSRATRYNRFHGAVNGLSKDTLRYMTQVDYRRHLAFVITTSDSDRERVVADARYTVDAEGDSAEFAIVVDDGWQRRGLGERAVRALGEAARREGLRWLHGSVLSANTPMLSLMRRCQFCCTPDREDDRLVHVEARLGHAAPTKTPQRERSWPMRWLATRRAAARS